VRDIFRPLAPPPRDLNRLQLAIPQIFRRRRKLRLELRDAGVVFQREILEPF
jgi:hypothetical protein